jgi:TldD protein
MKQTRRDFLRTGAMGAAALGLAGRAGAHTTERRHVTGYTVGDPAFRDVAMQALEAAKSAGATYADVRVGYRQFLSLGVIGSKMFPFKRLETHDFGVRVLVNGTWGFSHGTEMDKDSVAMVAKRAVSQASINSFGRQYKTEMAPAPPVPNGEWTMKVEIDPFTVSVQDQVNLLLATSGVVSRVKGAGGALISMSWSKETRLFASSEGSLISQTFYTAMPEGFAQIGGSSQDLMEDVSFQLPVFPEPAAAGYEVLLKANLQDSVMEAAENMMRTLKAKSVEPGRYELILDAHQLAKPLNDTLGIPLEMDRVLGYEANAEGTSYIAPPKDKLGAKPFTSPKLTLRANRKEPGAAARGWDDEGVAPEEFTLVEKGVLVDYHTNREMAMELDWWYKQTGKATRSHGCATSFTAEMCPISSMPNLAMDPSPDNLTLGDMVKNVKKGILVTNGGYGWSDQQGTGGQYYGEICQEIRNGKLIGYVKDCSYRFLSGPFWKNLLGVGGASTYRMTGIRQYKGQPFQHVFNSVGAVAAHFKECNIENTGREL